MTLGFDASTSVVGYAFTEGKVILDCGFIDIKNLKSNREKAWFVVDKLRGHKLIDKVDQINLEASLSGFSGPSSRSVVILLARWNSVFEYVLQDHYKKPVNLVNVATARKQAFGKAKIKGMKPKPYVKLMIEQLYDMTPWLIYNKIKNVDKRMEDAYDAVVISLFNPAPVPLPKKTATKTDQIP